MAAINLQFDPDGIVRATIDQPNNRVNVLNKSLWADLADICAVLDRRTDLNGLLIESAKPGIFIAGADLKELAALPVDDPAPTRAVLETGHDVLFAMEALPFPAVALIDGACLGGGLEVALACDFRIAGTNPKVKLGAPEVKLGLIPGWGGTQRLPRVIDPQKAANLLRSGEYLTADQARDVGLVSAVVPSEQLIENGRQIIKAGTLQRVDLRTQKHSPTRWPGPPADWAEKVAAMPAEERPAADAILDVLQKGCPLSLQQAIEIESAAFIPLMASTAARTRIAAFLNR